MWSSHSPHVRWSFSKTQALNSEGNNIRTQPDPFFVEDEAAVIASALCWALHSSLGVTTENLWDIASRLLTWFLGEQQSLQRQPRRSTPTSAENDLEGFNATSWIWSIVLLRRGSPATGRQQRPIWGAAPPHLVSNFETRPHAFHMAAHKTDRSLPDRPVSSLSPTSRSRVLTNATNTTQIFVADPRLPGALFRSQFDQAVEVARVVLHDLSLTTS